MSNKFFVRIYPDYKSDNIRLYPVKDSKGEVKIFFDNEKALRSYVKEEYMYSRVQEQAHLAAIYRRDRFKTMGDLLARRVEFARHKGLY